MNPLLPPTHLDAEAILRKSRSSFTPAFRLLPPERRRDLAVLYAFCRLADDLADTGDHPRAERYEALEAWRAGFRNQALHGLPENLRTLILHRALDPGLFLELLDGIATDLAPVVRMATRADLDLYCHRVAGTVGLLCLPIFGADPQRGRDYAATLGRALQYTNILRDTGSDLSRSRIYYPLDELAAAGLDTADFPSHAEAYLREFADGAKELFTRAAVLSPNEDADALRPARVMAAAYRTLLDKMRRDGLRVTKKHYRLTFAEKIFVLVRGLSAR